MSYAEGVCRKDWGRASNAWKRSKKQKGPPGKCNFKFLGKIKKGVGRVWKSVFRTATSSQNGILLKNERIHRAVVKNLTS